MRICFVIQGEGRGHFTQALALRELLERQGHVVVAALAGTNGRRPLPDYALNAFGVPLQSMFSPGFQFKGQRGISVAGSVAAALARAPQIRRSLRLIDETVARTRPDLIVNFMEVVTGLGKLLGRIQTPVLVLGHQFMLGHPEFVRSRHAWGQQWGFRNFVRLTGARSTKLALSFYPAAPVPRRRLLVGPPILRRRLFELPGLRSGDYLLVYLLNHGYAPDIERWCAENPGVPVHCFYDRPGAPPSEPRRPNLTFHQLHGERFLDLMAGCRAVVCTAGFESVCEAAYLGKPVLMIPVQNHIEQYLNALDAVKAGIGLRDTEFKLSRLLAPGLPCGGPAFREWVDQAAAITLRAVEQAASARL